MQIPLKITFKDIPHSDFIEAKIREKAFEKATQFVEQGPHEVIDKPVMRSFKVKGTKKERVDIEIQKGKAFI